MVPHLNRLSSKHLVIGSIGVALMVLALKTSAYWLTNSVGLYSDALESIVNLVAAVAVGYAVWLGKKPADHNHPYGHHKAEYLSAVAEGVMIVIAALAICLEAADSLLNPRVLNIPPLGLFLNGLAGILNGVWAGILIRRGRELLSPAFVADGKHLLTDVVTSLGVLIGVGIALLTGHYWLDPLLALVVGVIILWTGWNLIRASLGGLMDEALSEDEQSEIRAIIHASAAGAIEAHDLRSRTAGRVCFVEFHLVVPSEMSVFDAHEICDQIEHALIERLPGAHVTIHVEPENKAHAPHSDGSMVF